MKNIELYIAGVLIPLSDNDEGISSLSFSVEDVLNDGIAGSHAKRLIEVPATPQTDALFSPGISGVRTHPATLIEGTTTTFSGVARYEDCVLGDGEHRRIPKKYKISLIGENATWFDAFKNMKVKDLGLMPQHELTESFADANSNPDPDAQAWGYTLIVLNNTFDQGGASAFRFSPFVFIRPMLREAFRRAGYRMQSAFFDSPAGKRIIHPFPLRPHVWDASPALAYRVWRPDVDPDPKPPISNPHYTVPGGGIVDINTGGFYGADGYYTVKAAGYYVLAVANDSGQSIHRMRINGVPQPQYTTPFPATGTAIGFSARVLLEVNDRIDLIIGGFSAFVGFALFYAKPDFDSLVVDDYTDVNLPVYGNPEWTVAGMVKGLYAAGFMFSTNVQSGTVTIEARDTCIFGGQTIPGFFSDERDDLTPRIDLSIEASQPKQTGKTRVVYEWADDDADANLKRLNEKQDISVYGAAYNLNEGAFDTGVERKPNPYFAGTMHAIFPDQTHQTSAKNIQLPVMQSNILGQTQEKRGDFKPRILYFAGKRGGQDGYAKLYNRAAYELPAAFIVNYNDTGSDPSLSFADARRLDGVSVPGLMRVLLLQHLRRIDFGYIRQDRILFTELDVERLNFRRKVLLNESLYVMQQVEGYRPGQVSTCEVHLMPDGGPEGIHVAKISNAGQSGLIQQ